MSHQQHAAAQVLKGEGSIYDVFDRELGDDNRKPNNVDPIARAHARAEESALQLLRTRRATAKAVEGRLFGDVGGCVEAYLRSVRTETAYRQQLRSAGSVSASTWCWQHDSEIPFFEAVERPRTSPGHPTSWAASGEEAARVVGRLSRAGTLVSREVVERALTPPRDRPHSECIGHLPKPGNLVTFTRVRAASLPLPIKRSEDAARSAVIVELKQVEGSTAAQSTEDAAVLPEVVMEAAKEVDAEGFTLAYHVEAESGKPTSKVKKSSRSRRKSAKGKRSEKHMKVVRVGEGLPARKANRVKSTQGKQVVKKAVPTKKSVVT